MIIKRIIGTFLVILSLLFVYLQIVNLEYYGDFVKTLLLLGLTALFFFHEECDCKLFKLFLLVYALGEVISFSGWFIDIDYEVQPDYFYYIANSLYILAYTLLIGQILFRLNLRKIVSKYFVVILILIVLDIFCVSIVTATAEGVLTVYEYILEYLYNTVIMVLLSVAMINFMYRDDKRSINLLIASIFIVFSEIIQLAYFYVAEYDELNIVSSVLFILAFVFLYLHAKLKNEEPVDLLERSLEV